MFLVFTGHLPQWHEMLAAEHWAPGSIGLEKLERTRDQVSPFTALVSGKCAFSDFLQLASRGLAFTLWPLSLCSLRAHRGHQELCTGVAIKAVPHL